MRPVSRALSRTLLITLAAIAAPSLAHAQSCLGFPLQPGQRTIGIQAANGFEDGGAGAFYSQVSRSGTALQLDGIIYEIWDGPDVIDKRSAVSARMGRPVGLGGSAGAPGSMCAVLDVGAVTGESSASGFRGGAGLFYALSGRFGSVYGGPMLLGAYSEDGTSAGIGVLAGVSGRLGPLVMNVAFEPPLLPFVVDPALHLRLGFAWGRAEPSPAR